MFSLLASIYKKIADVRNRLYERGVLETYDLGARAISIGNITAGGTGKTRLAAQAAGRAADAFPDGVWWVPLASLHDPELVLPTAAQALGAKDDLSVHIADKRLVIVFDNFEHVVGAAIGLSELLASCPT